MGDALASYRMGLYFLEEVALKKLYDPKLREGADEFRALCEKYDCMGVALFVSPTHSEFVNRLDPSWSVMRMEDNHHVRFRSKAVDFPSKQAQDASTEATVHGVTSIIEWSEKLHENWLQVLMALRNHMTILHSKWGDPDSVPGEDGH